MADFIVTPDAQRPASMNGKCFYCGQPIGEKHKSNCVLVKKKVRVRMTVEYEIDVPASWDKEKIEFHRNNGSWCSSNAIDELQSIADSGDCLCGRMEYEYLEDTSESCLGEV